MLWELLIDALLSDNINKCLIILKKFNATIETLDPSNGWILLFYSIKHHKHSIFNYCIANSQLFSTDFLQNNQILLSIQYNNLHAFKHSIKLFPNYISNCNSLGKTPLLLACESGNTDFVQTLLSLNSSQQSDYTGCSPLHIASSWGYFDIVTLLIQNNSNPFQINNSGFTPLDYSYSLEMKNHILYCIDCIKDNTPIITPTRKNPDFASSQTATAYVSYLRTIF